MEVWCGGDLGFGDLEGLGLGWVVPEDIDFRGCPEVFLRLPGIT